MRHSSDVEPLLQELEEYTTLHHPEAHMLSGKLQGRFLSLFSRLLQPSAILEIGTFTGYSALCLAEGLSPQGVLHTIESREQDAAIARSFFERSSWAHQIKGHLGEAHEVLKSLSARWDLVFIDADKVSYIDYFNIVLPALRPGGFILADNGQVFEAIPKGKNAKAIAAFNDYIIQHPQVEVLMLPLRDGISVIQKK
jgi:predicted O-methyltransferase YrrM